MAGQGYGVAGLAALDQHGRCFKDQAVIVAIEILGDDAIRDLIPSRAIQHQAAEYGLLGLNGMRRQLKAVAGTQGYTLSLHDALPISEASVKAGQPISRSEVRMPTGPIRVTGDHQVQLHLHTDVDVTLQVTIVAEE